MTASAVTLYTVADESRKKMADGVARSASRLCRRDGKICCCGDALSTIFLLALFCALLPTFRFSFFFSYFFPCIPLYYVHLLRVPSCVQQPSATLSKYVFYTEVVVRVLSACVSFVPYPISEILLFFLFVCFFFFRSSYFSGWWRFFLLCSLARYAST